MRYEERSSVLYLWAPDDYVAAERAWRTGWGDVPYVARHRRVPGMVQLGVISHAPWERLSDLARARRSSWAARAWGRDVLGAVTRVLAAAGDPGALAHLQSDALQPAERRRLNDGSVTMARDDLIRLLDRSIGAPATGRR